MVKQIFKEIIIVLLLTLVILLVISVLFYDYNPSNKVVPNKVAYTVPENVKEDLEEANIQKEELEMKNISYTVNGADLNAYKRNNTYNPSKKNPYANSLLDGTTEVVNNTSESKTTGENTKTETNRINKEVINNELKEPTKSGLK